MIIEQTAPSLVVEDRGRPQVKVFLAGSINMGTAIDWQSWFVTKIEAASNTIPELAHIDVVLCNPRRPSGSGLTLTDQTTSNVELVTQIEWELEHLETSDIVIMYLTNDGIAPISLLELGLFGRKIPQFIVCREDGYPRQANVDIVCQRYGIPTATDLNDLINQTLLSLKEIAEDECDRKRQHRDA